MADAYFGGTTQGPAYNLDANGYVETSITTPNGRVAANGTDPIRIVALGATCSGRNGTITVTIDFGASSASFSRGYAADPGFSGLVGAGTIGNITGGSTHTFRVRHSGAMNFRRSSSGTTTNQAGYNWTGVIYGGYTYHEVPSAPQSLTATASTTVSGRITLNFSGPASNGGSAVTSYNVYYSNGTYIGNTTSGTYNVSGLTPGTSYSFVVRARNAVSDASSTQSINSNTATAVAPGVPTAPQNLTATPSTTVRNRIDLSWAAPATTNGTITGYTIYRNGAFLADTTGTGTTYASTGLTGHTSYSYYVTARNALADSNGTESPASNTVNATSPDVPSAPRNLTAIADAGVAGRIALGWDAPTTTGTGGITGYSVYQSPSTLLGTTSGATTAYTVNGLTPGSTYSFFVRARNAIADTTGTFSPDSNVATEQALGAPQAPTAPSAVASTTIAGRLTLSWTPPIGTLTGYYVYKIVNANEVLVGTTSSTTMVLDQQPTGVSQTFVVRARNSYTDSINSQGAASVQFSGTAVSAVIQSVNNLSMTNNTNATFSGTYAITSVGATTFTYAKTAANISTITVPSGGGSLVNNTNAALNGTYTITTPSTDVVSYTKTTSNIPANTPVSSGTLLNNTNVTFNGSYAVSAVDGVNKTVSYSKTAANISSRVAQGTITNTSNTVYNGTDIPITAVTENTIQYAKTNANLTETQAQGTVYNRTNENVYNGSYIVSEVPSHDMIRYERISGDAGTTKTNLATNPSFESAVAGTGFVRTNHAHNPAIGGSLLGLAGGRTSLTDGGTYIRGTITDALQVNLAQLVSTGTTASNLGVALPGQTFTVSAEARSSASFTMSTAVQFFDSSIVYISASQVQGASTATNPDTFTAMAPVTATAPAGTAYVRWIVGIHGTEVRAIGDTLDVRNVLVERSTSSGRFFSGASTTQKGFTYAWTGTAFQSASTETTTGVTVNTNFVRNPSFEVDTSLWSHTGTSLTRVTTDSYSGVASAQFVTTAQLNVALTTEAGLTSSLAYTASVWVKGEVGKTVRVDLRELTAASASVGDTLGTNTTMTGAWQRLSVTRTFGATGTQASLLVRNGTVGAHTFLIDAAQIEVGTTATDYFDGGTSAGGDFVYAWSGAANASASLQRGVSLAALASGIGSVGSDGNSSIFQSFEWAKTGTKSFRQRPVVNNTTSYTYLILSGLTVGQTYTAIATSRAVAPLTGTLRADARSLAYSNSLTTVVKDQAPNVAGEYTHRITFTHVAGRLLIFWNGAPIGGGDVWWDDFMIVEGEYDGPYFDGSTANNYNLVYSWSGTADASTSTRTPVNYAQSDILEPFGEIMRNESRANLDVLYRSGWSG